MTCLQAGSSTVDCSRVPDGKRRFLACLRAGWRAPTCTLATDFELHPSPSDVGLDEKLEFMRRERLGPFAEDR